MKDKVGHLELPGGVRSDRMRRNFQRRRQDLTGVPGTDRGSSGLEGDGGDRETGARATKQRPPRWTRKKETGCPVVVTLLLFIASPQRREGKTFPGFKNPFCTRSRIEIRCPGFFPVFFQAHDSLAPRQGLNSMPRAVDASEVLTI